MWATEVGESTTYVWDGQTFELLQSVLTGNVTFLSPSGETAASCFGSAVCLWRPADGQVLRTVVCVGERNYRLFEPDGQPHRRAHWGIKEQTQHYVAISPDGHFAGSPGIARQLVYVVQTAAGSETLTYDEFARKYAWRNETEEVSRP